MKKILIFAGVGLALIILSLIAINMTSKDTSKPQIESIFKTNSTIISLSKLAQDRASTYTVKVVATNIATTTASDSTQLSAYFKDRYGKVIKLKKPSKAEQASDPTTALAAKEDGVDFDTQYKKVTQQQLEANLNQIRTLYNETKREDLRAVLATAFANTQKNIEEIKQLSSTSED